MPENKNKKLNRRISRKEMEGRDKSLRPCLCLSWNYALLRERFVEDSALSS